MALFNQSTLPGQVRLGWVRLGVVRLGQVQLGVVRLDSVRLGSVRRLFERTFFDQSTCFGQVEVDCSNKFFRNQCLFRKNGIRKNVKNEKISKERNSKEKFQFRKNVIRSNDLVPKNYLFAKVSFFNFQKLINSFMKKNQN